MVFMPRFPLSDEMAPQPIGERYSLLTAARGPVAMPSKAQGGGLTYYPTSCGFTRDWPVECGPDDSPGESPGDNVKDFDEGTAFTEGDPFALYSTLKCGSAGLGKLEADARATLERRLRLRFANGRATGIERNAALAFAASGAPQLVSPDPTNLVSVISTLEQWLYGVQDMSVDGGGTSQGQGYGSRGYIHATPRVSAWAMEHHLIEPEQGNLWKTAMGSIWVFGGGYSGALPGDAAAVDGTDAIYITGQVTVWEGEEIQPSLRETFDRTTNQWMALLERIYMVTWDCAIAAAPFEYGTGSP